MLSSPCSTSAGIGVSWRKAQTYEDEKTDRHEAHPGLSEDELEAEVRFAMQTEELWTQSVFWLSPAKIPVPLL